jgi:glycosyltransferase involved in cell wall biosynthesis
MHESRPSDAPEHVLLWMPGGKRVLGGHVVQLERTAEALSDAGLEIDTDFSSTPEITDVDLVHGFGLHAADIRHWHSRGIPVVLSTIYWNRSYRADGGNRRMTARTLAGRGGRAARFARAALQGRGALLDASLRFSADENVMYAAFESADLLLPNAVGEGEGLVADFGVTTPVVPVPNGVDPEKFAAPGLPFEEREFVLYVGRIEPHKNQLGLINALKGSGLPLMIAGHEHPDHAAYVRECRAAGDGWVDFHLSSSSFGASELADLYRRARVHVVPSWFETTGLVSLEASLSGCSIATTSRGHAREYLDTYAWYLDPADQGSILGAVRSAWENPPSPELRQRVLDRFTWSHVAEATMAAYATLPPRRTGRSARQ